MSKRIIEIGTEGFYLKTQHHQLKIIRDDDEIGSVPIEDLAAVIIDHPQTRISQVLLAELLSNNVMVVISDTKHQPVGMLLPLQHHVTQSERFGEQIALSKSGKKRLWKHFAHRIVQTE